MSEEILRNHRELWRQKPVLRAIYSDFYERITAACRPGLSLEIGGGSGNLKDFAREVVSTDIVQVPWLDAAADAQALPFAAGSFANVVSVERAAPHRTAAAIPCRGRAGANLVAVSSCLNPRSLPLAGRSIAFSIPSRLF